MTEIHDFSTPRNLYEKLVRDGQKLDIVVNGDNVFNFVSTAFHLQQWIKQSPLVSSEVVKRLLRKISRDENVKHCQKIIQAKESFKLEIFDKGSKTIMHIGEEKLNVFDFRNRIIEIYENYFKSKGH
ncbi:hypothetical protein ACFLS9_04590 [Bacteroidota bacterium]